MSTFSGPFVYFFHEKENKYNIATLNLLLLLQTMRLDILGYVPVLVGVLEAAVLILPANFLVLLNQVQKGHGDTNARRQFPGLLLQSPCALIFIILLRAQRAYIIRSLTQPV